jgi:hypothetical protein
MTVPIRQQGISARRRRPFDALVQHLNVQKLGSLTDLESFLLGRERGTLEDYRPILLDVQAGRCFYCHEDIR